MDNLFPSAQSKIQRANKHIRDLNSMLSEFGDSEFYELTVEFDPIRKTNHLRFDIDASGFTTDAALITGDVLHNLRSALDILYYEVVAEGTGTRWTRFPICDKRGDLIRRLDAALSSHQVSIGMHDFIIDTIKPYQDGNYALWALHDLNILDKHKLLIPAMQVVRFEGVRLEDEQGGTVGKSVYIMDESSRVRLRDADDRRVTIKDRGHASAVAIFDIGVPFEGKAILLALRGLSEEVSRTLKAFAILIT